KIEVQWVLHKNKPDVKEKGAGSGRPSLNTQPGDTGSQIVSFDKYNLLSPEINAESDPKPNFLDEKRIPAANGSYTLELTIIDKNTIGSKYTIKEPISISFPNDKVVFSDIELLESYSKSTVESKISKSGYDLIPFLTNFFPRDMNSIKFY